MLRAAPLMAPRPVQVILSTHSPNLASTIPLANMVLMEGSRAFPSQKNTPGSTRGTIVFLSNSSTSPRQTYFSPMASLSLKATRKPSFFGTGETGWHRSDEVRHLHSQCRWHRP